MELNTREKGETMQELNEKEIDSILVEAGLINEQLLNRARMIQEKTGEKIEKILLSDDIIDYKAVLKQKAESMGVDFIDLENVPVNNDAVSRVGSDVVERYFVFPFDVRNNFLLLAMRNPDDLFIIDEIKMYTQMEIKPYLADSRLIAKAIEYFYGISMEFVDESEKNNGKGVCKTNENTGKEKLKTNIGMDNSENTDISGMVNALVSKFSPESLKNAKITDIHIDTVNKKVLCTLVLDY